MRRIDFIAPVDSMRGNLSGAQKLLYAKNDNPAFEAPAGRQYARNYQTRFIGAKRASDNLKYFAVKTKAATLITPATKLNMALTGGVGAIYAAILEAPTMRARLEYAWKNYFHSPKTFRAFMDTYLRDMLTRKAKSVQIGRDSEDNIIVVGNPWNMSTTATYIPDVSDEVLIKFWLQLAAEDGGAAPIYFTIDGRKCVAFEGLTWDNNLTRAAKVQQLDNYGGTIIGGNEHVSSPEGTNMLVSFGGTPVGTVDVIVADRKYVTIAVSEE